MKGSAGDLVESRRLPSQFLRRRMQPGSRQRADWKILERYRDVTSIGFQRQLLRLSRHGVQGEEKTALRRENFEKMFEEGLRRGARYFEIGADEARDFPDLVDRFAHKLPR